MKWCACRSLICLFLTMAVCSLAGCAAPGSDSRAKADTDRRSARRSRDDGAPKVGDVGPRFALKMLDDDSKKVELASYRGNKPVVLFFGSYT